MGIAERKNREFQRREREILDAALPLLSGEDWQSITVEEMAAAAEIGKGTIYKHFESKDEIYGRLALDFHALLLEELRRIEEGLGPEERIRAIMKVIWRAHSGRREYQRLIEYTSREGFRERMSSKLRGAFEQMSQELMGIYARVLEDGISAGLFPRRPLEPLFLGPQAIVNGMILMIWTGCFGDDGDERFLDELTDFMLAGLMYRERIGTPDSRRASRPKGAAKGAGRKSHRQG